MSFSQIIVLIFGLVVTATSVAGVIIVARSAKFRLKPLWIIGCLFGFLGFGIGWTSTDDLFILFGVSIPVFSIFKVLPSGPIIVKTFFPFVAAAALVKEFSSEPPSTS